MFGRTFVEWNGIVCALFGVLISANLACTEQGYCIDCEDAQSSVFDEDGALDGDIEDGGVLLDDAGNPVGMDACVSSGIEQCDDLDNDCDGKVDEGDLPTVGETCGSNVGACSEGVTACESGKVVCTGGTKTAFEKCNNVDDDCDGTVDENNPEAGLICGTNQGECEAGVQQCDNGTLICVGQVEGGGEACNGLDDDCDGRFDEGLTTAGDCGPPSDMGICTFGVNTCIGGSMQCVGASYAELEVCDGVDHDCDGNPLNGYNLNSDAQNCGSCGNVCTAANALMFCSNAQCAIAVCNNDYFDLNNLPADGCEFGPCSFQGNEICNGIDDDCDGLTDEGTDANPPAICDQDGACSGTTATCDGANGYVCDYGPNVPTNNGVILAETNCDEIDNDCDGKIDEAFPTKGAVCDDGEIGLCRDTGVIACNSNDDGVVCTAVDNPADDPPAQESCNNVDDDCDGSVDEEDPRDWVTLAGGVEIFKYEASRPDSTATEQGFVTDAAVCSAEGRIPWTNITYLEAKAACESIGADLCTENEWQTACETDNAPPSTTQQGSEAILTSEAEDGVVDNGAWAVTSAITGYSGAGYMQAPDNGNENKNGGAINGNNTPRIDYTFTFTQTGTHYLWIRMLSLQDDSDSVWYAFDDTNGGLGNDERIYQSTRDSWDWVGFNSNNNRISFNVGTTGAHTISLYQREDGTAIDRILITPDIDYLPFNGGPPQECQWSYEIDCKSYQPNTCNGEDFDGDSVTPGDQDVRLASGSMPACFADWEGGGAAYDLSGNVKEWNLARQAGVNPIRGGSFNNTAIGTSCQFDFLTADDEFFLPNIGFRCCR